MDSSFPSHLLPLCRTIFLRCREFESYRTLRTVFITEELRPFRIGLREADNLGSLVDLNLEYLIEQRLKGGRPVLPIFLAVLRDRYEPDDALHEDLEDLFIQVQAAMLSSTDRPASQIHHPILFDLLLKLDYTEQVRMVKHVIQSQSVAAFLVHGEPEFGQRLLVTRLARLCSGWQNAQLLRIDAGSNGTGKSSHSLWRQVACKLGMPSNTMTRDIAEKVCDWLQTQDVIFILDTVDYIPASLLAAWVQDFWQPLADAARRNLQATQLDTHLILFMVDHTGCVCDWAIPLERQFDPTAYTGNPLHLPAVSKFTPEILDNWLDIADALPARLSAQALLESCENGKPELIFEAICAHCGLSWEGDLARWLV